MSDGVCSPEEYSADAGQIRLTFRHVGDRWRHLLALRHGESWSELLASVEGNPAEQQLPSPAFQELRVERPNDAQTEFQLFGQSGKGVYSGAVRVDRDLGTIDFDLCVRVRPGGTFTATATTYRVSASSPWKPSTAAANRITIGDDDNAIGMVVVSISSAAPASVVIQTDAQNREFEIGCCDRPVSNASQEPQTIRWRYQVSAEAIEP